MIGTIISGLPLQNKHSICVSEPRKYSMAQSAYEQRDYGLLGPEAEKAVTAGLKSAEWYHTNLSRKEMKALMQRSDEIAIRDTLLWLGLIIAFASLAIFLWPSSIRRLALSVSVLRKRSQKLWEHPISRSIK